LLPVGPPTLPPTNQPPRRCNRNRSCFPQRARPPPHIERPGQSKPRQDPSASDRRNWQPAIPIIQFGLPSFKIASGHLAVPIGGWARVLQYLSIAQCDALCNLAVSGRSRMVPPALNGTVHASAVCAWARRPGRRRGSRQPAWQARLPDEGFYLHRQGPANETETETVLDALPPALVSLPRPRPGLPGTVRG